MSKWGDEELEDEQAGQPNDDGVKTIVEFKTNDKGEKVKVTRRVREYKSVRKVNKRVEERRKVRRALLTTPRPFSSPFHSVSDTPV